MSKKAFLLYFIIVLEGYAVLSLELLAIKITIPFVGSGADTISIIIAGVLLPLACGYYRGGQLQFNHPDQIDKKLQNNFLVSLGILSLGLGYGLLIPVFEFIIQDLEFKNRLLLTVLYTSVVVVVPVYLLGQTIPVITHHFKNANLPQTAGKILFYSTLGSFAGAVITTIIFMNWIGVPYTACITLLSLFVLIVLLNKKGFVPLVLASLFLILGVALNSPPVLKAYNIVNSNAYSLIQVYEHPGNIVSRIFKMNGAFSSAIIVDDNPQELPMSYANYIEKRFVRPIQKLGPEAKILVLGAGGFTIGRQNTTSQFTYIDIDPDLKDIVEDEFLKAPLGKNKQFIAQPVRSYLTGTDEKFDLVILDIGKGLTGSPEHLVTQEFFNQVEAKVKPNGLLVAHYFVSPLMDDEYSRNLDTTLRSVMPHISRVIVGPYNPWPDAPYKASVVYIYKNHTNADRVIYTDVLNRSASHKGKDLD